MDLSRFTKVTLELLEYNYFFCHKFCCKSTTLLCNLLALILHFQFFFQSLIFFFSPRVHNRVISKTLRKSIELVLSALQSLGIARSLTKIEADRTLSYALPYAVARSHNIDKVKRHQYQSPLVKILAILKIGLYKCFHRIFRLTRVETICKDKLFSVSNAKKM